MGFLSTNKKKANMKYVVSSMGAQDWGGRRVKFRRKTSGFTFTMHPHLSHDLDANEAWSSITVRAVKDNCLFYVSKICFHHKFHWYQLPRIISNSHFDIFSPSIQVQCADFQRSQRNRWIIIRNTNPFLRTGKCSRTGNFQKAKGNNIKGMSL